MSLLEEAEHKCSLHLLSQMDPRSGSPSTLWTITHNKDLLHLTARNKFRIHLVLGCHGLESDAARFRKRRGELEVVLRLQATRHKAEKQRRDMDR